MKKCFLNLSKKLTHSSKKMFLILFCVLRLELFIKSSLVKKVSVRWTARTNSLRYCDILSLQQSLYWTKFICSQSFNKLSLYFTVLSVHKIYKYFLKLQKLLWCYKYMIFYNNIMTFYFLLMTSMAMVWRYNVAYWYLCPWLRYLD